MRKKTILERIPLLPGNHPTRKHGMCAKEFVAWLAGERHSDQPDCTCPVLASIVRTFNDVVPDVETRDRYLRPLVPLLINTRADESIQRQRAFLALDTAVRLFAPLALIADGNVDAAEAIRRLPEIQDRRTAAAAAEALEPHGRAVHAAWWTASRAAEGKRVGLWISGVVHANGTKSWQGMRRLIESMFELPTRVPR